MTRIKICGIRDKESARAACDAGADALGFVFYGPSPRAVTADAIAPIVAELTPLVSAVGLFVDPSHREVQQVLDAVALDVLQFHGGESAEFCESFGRPYIKAIPMRPDVDLAAEVASHPMARAFLLDAWHEDMAGGTGEVFDWSRIGSLKCPWILAGGLTPENVGEAIAQVSPKAVDVSGGVEVERGVKDAAKIKAFVAAVGRADLIVSSKDAAA